MKYDARTIEAAAAIAYKHREQTGLTCCDGKEAVDQVAQGYFNASLNIAHEIRALPVSPVPTTGDFRCHNCKRIVHAACAPKRCPDCQCRDFSACAPTPSDAMETVEKLRETVDPVIREIDQMIHLRATRSPAIKQMHEWRDTITTLLTALEGNLQGNLAGSGAVPMSDDAKQVGKPCLVYFKPHGWLRVEWGSSYLEDDEITPENGIWMVDDFKHGPYAVRGYCDGDDTHYRPVPTPPLPMKED